MKEGPDMRSDSREPVQIDIYLNILYSYFVSLFLYECLGPSEVRRRLLTSTTCSDLVYVSKVFHCRSVQFGVFVFTYLRGCLLHWTSMLRYMANTMTFLHDGFPWVPVDFDRYI